MSATLHRFRSKRTRIKEEQGLVMRQLLLDFAEDHDLPGDAVGRIVAAVDGEIAPQEGWRFVMLDPKENAAVVKWLQENSRRPLNATRLWATLYTALRSDTGEIMLTRDELAEDLGIAPRNVSEIMTDLVGIGAVSRRRDGRRVSYFMNSTIATHLTGKARTDAQAAAPVIALYPDQLELDPH